MQPFARTAVIRGGQQVLRAFKPKIQASKPKNNLDFAADAVVVSQIYFLASTFSSLKKMATIFRPQ
jgi:hypothetical protein